MPTQHDVTIRANPQAAFSDYQFEAVCSCQWQALATTQERAEAYVRGHLGYHGTYANEVAREATPALPPDAIPVADPRPEPKLPPKLDPKA